MWRVFLPAVLLLLVSHGQDGKDVPMMEYLPNGTSLINVSIPSYDDERKPSSLLKADEVTIVDKDAGIMEARNVNLKMFTENDPITIQLQKARYFFHRRYLEAEQHTMINNNSVSITGTGACYDLSSKEIFIKGPMKAVIASKEVAHRWILGMVSAVALLPAEAAPPSVPTAGELAALTSPASTTPPFNVPSADKIDAQKSSLRSSLAETDSAQRVQAETMERVAQQNAAGEKKLAAFLERTGQADLLVQNEGAEAVATEELVAPEQALVVTCDDGMFYDAEEGVMVCLKNVVVEEPRFSLRCTEQLKIFLNAQKQEKNDANMGFGSTDLKELIASGNVVITYKDTGNQPPVTLTGNTAHFDAVTEEITMTGGKPTMKQGQNFIEALEPTWLKLSRKGVRFGPGKKRTVYLTEEDE